MYRSYLQEVEYCQQHLAQYQQLSSKADFALFPDFSALATLNQLFKDSEISLGAQDCSAHEQGAYTGQVSAQSLGELGCDYVIVGHSERRALGETNVIISQKTSQAFAAELTPIICIGEPEDVYHNKQTQAYLTNQLTPLMPVLSPNYFKSFCIAYEPIWAIGTGQTPNIDEIEQIQAFIRQFVETETGANTFRVVYGGSVNAKNCAELKTMMPFEGFLIGKASLDIQEFAQIVNLID